MAMANEDKLHKCVTEFMLDTCRYSRYRKAWRACAVQANMKYISPNLMFDAFISGSTEEFYITPVHSCIGDIDLMYCFNGCIAIQGGETPPTELPDCYMHIVTACEITDSHQPGYVYLQQSPYILEKNDNGRYDHRQKENSDNMARYFSNTQRFYNTTFQQHIAQRIYHRDLLNSGLLQNMMSDNSDIHGPALRFMLPTVLDIDLVTCIRCLVWPPQAADWPTRYRKHSWPDLATINTVVSNGCDVVRAVHPLCRQDEWMSQHQWRLSFSRAEVILLNSWSPVQQIVYHMLRFVMKRKVFTEEYDKYPNLPKLSNYHIKTLMLWECEQKPQSWWSAKFSLIKLCSSLLRKLSDWVAFKRCQQYFISNCNLINHFVEDFASLITCTRLQSIADEKFLLSFFVKNYILYPADMSTSFDDICSSNTLRVIRDAADVTLSTMQFQIYLERLEFETGILGLLHIVPVNHKMTHIYKEELQNFDQRHQDYFAAVTSLHVACKTSIQSLTEELLETLWTIFYPCAEAVCDMDSNESASGGILFIRKAIKLAYLNDVGNSALEMLHNEMAKAYLHHSFAYGQESTYSVVHVLLAVLYYKSGHYQAAIDHCKQVLNHTASYGSRRIGAGYLPQIDESVDAVFGLILIYQRVQSNALKSDDHLLSNTIDFPAVTTELLARYLCSRCSIVDDAVIEVAMYRRHLVHSERPPLSDVLLFKVVESQLNKCTKSSVVQARTQNRENAAPSSMDTSLLVTSVELVALEKLITYRQLMVSELHSEPMPIINEFEALHAYKCGLFEKCLERCRSHLNKHFHLSTHQLLPVGFPELLSLLDGDLVSVFGVARLINPVLLLSVLQLRGQSAISVRTLSLYLMVQCQKKLRIGSIYMHDTLRLIRFVHNATANDFILDRSVLRVVYRSLLGNPQNCPTTSVADC